MARPKRYNTTELTNHLRELAAEVHDWVQDPDDPTDGRIITRGEALARLLFRKALGYSEEIVDDEGNKTVKEHRPEAWAIQLIWDRVEGKTPQAITEDTRRIKAVEKVRELAKARLNAVATGDDPGGKPPRHRPKKETE